MDSQIKYLVQSPINKRIHFTGGFVGLRLTGRFVLEELDTRCSKNLTHSS